LQIEAKLGLRSGVLLRCFSLTNLDTRHLYLFIWPYVFCSLTSFP